MFNEREEEQKAVGGEGLEEWHHVVLQRSRAISEPALKLSFKPARKPIKTKAKKQMRLKWEQLARQHDQAGRAGHSRVKGAPTT